jgi:hypothetical protein
MEPLRGLGNGYRPEFRFTKDAMCVFLRAITGLIFGLWREGCRPPGICVMVTVLIAARKHADSRGSANAAPLFRTPAGYGDP